ncbi:MAG: hypothetical protein NTV56_19305 [Alphaproteobacteria bacterium]|nr:hypothetical protein [Alphaproteobacteria bacterium]
MRIWEDDQRSVEQERLADFYRAAYGELIWAVFCEVAGKDHPPIVHAATEFVRLYEKLKHRDDVPQPDLHDVTSWSEGLHWEPTLDGVINCALDVVVARLSGRNSSKKEGDLIGALRFWLEMQKHHEEERAQERTRQQAERDERRKTERVYLIWPDSKPALPEELGFGQGVRSPEELVAIEQRLGDMGFEIETSGNVVACRTWHDGRLVLADPREKGRIMVRVFATPGSSVKSAYVIMHDNWRAETLKRHLSEFAAKLPKAHKATRVGGYILPRVRRHLLPHKVEQ